MPVAAGTAPPKAVFISYSRADAAVVARLEQRLEAAGFDVFLDTSQAEAMIVALSRAAGASPNVAKEVGLASQAGCALIPVRIEDVPGDQDRRRPGI